MIWYAVKHRTSQAIQFFERNVDYLILGKLLNNVNLGYYSFAFNIMYLPVKRISDLFRDILFPTFSKFKHDKKKLIAGYVKSLRLVMMVSFPIMLIISFNSELIILTVFGEKWIAAAEIVSILSIGGAFQSITQFGDVVFTSLGHPEKTIYITLSRILGTVISIILGIKFGILGVSYFLTASKILSFIVILFLLYRLVSLDLAILFSNIKGNLLSITAFICLELVIQYSYPELINSWLKISLSFCFISFLMICTNLSLIKELKVAFMSQL
jgi:PST family polysaccharide transporter